MFFSWWTFRIFFIFSARGRGRGSPLRQEGAGVGFLLKIPGGGGVFSHEGGGGAGRVSAGNFGGGGLNIFWGVEMPNKFWNCPILLPEDARFA